MAMGRVLGARARAAAAVRQRRAGESRDAPRACAVARRPRRVGARARHDLPGPPHRQPLDVSCRRRDVRRGDESIPPRLPHRHPAAAGGGTLPFPDWHWALFRLAADRRAHRPLPHLPNRLSVYLAFYVLGHMDSVFIFARTYLDIDTGWGFATGAPTGLVKDPWNIRLVPHYWLGVFFVLAHLAAGARAVVMAHGVRKAFADRFMVGGAVAAGIVATVIMLGMCGMRVQFI